MIINNKIDTYWPTNPDKDWEYLIKKSPPIAGRADCLSYFVITTITIPIIMDRIMALAIARLLSVNEFINSLSNLVFWFFIGFGFYYFFRKNKMKRNNNRPDYIKYTKITLIGKGAPCSMNRIKSVTL